jgi:uncharacterized protein (DUF302 family)
LAFGAALSMVIVELTYRMCEVMQVHLDHTLKKNGMGIMVIFMHTKTA